MNLIYKCEHCGAASQHDAAALRGRATVEQILASLDTDAPIVRTWIRHQCAPGVHGLAGLAAVIEGPPPDEPPQRKLSLVP